MLLLLAATSFAQTNPAAVAARKWRLTHEHEIVREFSELLAIPNVASDRANIQHNAEAIAAMMEKRGVHARLVFRSERQPGGIWRDTPTEHAPPTSQSRQADRQS